MPGPVYKPKSEGAFTEDVLTNVQLGAIEPQTTIPEGTTLTEFAKMAAIDLFVPTFISPNFNLSDNISNLQIIGKTVNFTLTFHFDRGEIRGKNVNDVWDANETQNPRAGAATSYKIDGTTQPGNSLAVSKTVAQGDNEFSATVDYAEGPQPKDSVGNDYGNPYPAGTSPVQKTDFEGVYPIFGTTNNITTATQQPLVSMLHGNNVVLDLVAETGGNKQFFELPDAWLANRPLAKVEFFNPVSGQFDPADQLATFDVSNTQHTVQGNNINYKRYTNKGSDRGAIKIRLKF